MPRLYLILLLFALGSCKKDLLPVRQLRQIATGTADRLNTVRFLTDRVGFCIGGTRFDNSRILRTLDGGLTWTASTSTEAPKELIGITRSASGRLFLIGFDGKLLYSDDLGDTWTFRQLRYDSYKVIAMRSPDNPVAIGGISFDRGDIMELNGYGELVRYDMADYELNDIYFGAEGRAYRCGYGAIQTSSDSGRAWNWTSYKNDNYSAIDVLGDRVWVCGREGSIVRSLDGGRTWTRTRNGPGIAEKKYRLNDIAFRTATEGFAVGEDGTVLFSSDAGEHWSQFEPFTSAHLMSVTVHPDGRVFICGEGGTLWEMRF